jgi:hypothetical protein
MDRKREMMRIFSFGFMFASLFLWGSNSLWAVYAPEPKSGGRFFHAKGTRSADEYEYMGRTGTRQFENYYYGRPEYGDGVRYEALHLKPYASYTGEYDSNVFLTDDNTEGDYISRLNWGLDAEVPMQEGKYLIGGGVHSESEWFAEHGGENNTDWIYQGEAEANFNHFSIEVFEEFRDNSSRAGNELTEREERAENYLNGLITIPFAEFFLETEVSHYHLEFDDAARQFFDRQEFRTIPRIGFNVGDRTQVLAEYDLTFINYDAGDRDGTAHQGSLGARGFLGDGDLVSYQVWAGWQFRNYDSGDDFNGFTFRSDVEYRRSEVSRFFFEANRLPVESVSVSNSFIVRHEIAGGWRRQLSERLRGELRGGVGFYDYAGDRFDFFWEPGVRVDYRLPGDFASLFAEYRFTARHSDAANQDYLRHIANGGIRFEL